MIGGASLPKVTLPTPATAHAAASQAEHAHEDAAAPTAQRAPAHDTHPGGRADRPSAHEARGAKAHAGARQQRGVRRDHAPRADDDASSARNAFARLLDQAPSQGDAANAATSVLPAANAVSPETTPPTMADTHAASLPDQLLGLLASLAPGAQPGAAAPTAPAATPAGASPATVAPAPAAKPATPPVGADAAGILLPALSTAEANPSTTATGATLAVAAHAEDGGTPLPSLHDTRPDTPAPTPFDALVRATAPTAPDVARPVVPATPTPVTQPTDPRAGYGDELGGSVVWMADQKISHAEVRVVPDHLGPIDVKLQLDGAQVHATFLSAQPEVRHALEASLPRLRDLLGQHGLQLAQADVGQRQSDPRAARGGHATADSRDAGDEGLAAPAPGARLVRGLLDEYA